MAGAAASIIVLFGVGGYFYSQEKIVSTPVFTEEYQLRDTYTNPEEAWLEAEKALLLVSNNMNKGISHVTIAANDIDRTNNFVREAINNLNIK